MTINENTGSTEAVGHAISGGKFRLRLVEDNGPGSRHADVLDDNGKCIGGASDYIYQGRGWAVHTKPFAGFVPEEQIEYVTS